VEDLPEVYIKLGLEPQQLKLYSTDTEPDISLDSLRKVADCVSKWFGWDPDRSVLKPSASPTTGPIATEPANNNNINSNVNNNVNSTIKVVVG
jgi:hypothetical protein